MDLVKALDLGRKLMNEHNLHDWDICEAHSRKFYGRCCYSEKWILLSRYLIPKCKDEYTKNTIIHEIAHALVGPGHAHDEVWYKKFMEIGGIMVTSRKERLTDAALILHQINKNRKIKRLEIKRAELDKLLRGQSYQK